ncbi:MAG: hydantoinase B/oxoprolinase family protein [Pseudomonadota bacterium]
MTLDPLKRQLVWDRLLAIVEEQAQVLMRTAFSTVVREAGDLSAGVFDPRGRMLAQAVTGTPGHVNAMAASVAKFLAAVPTLEPGDVLMTNDPWDGTGHLNDFTLVSPVFYQDQLVALFASTSHIADVGGRGFGPDANELFEEGIRIPISHLYRAGVRDETLLRLLLANVRDPVVAEGDLFSLVACNDAGSRALIEAMTAFGLGDLSTIAAHILARSEAAMGAAIAELPNGTARSTLTIDGYDKPLQLGCELSIEDDRIRVDLIDVPPPSPFGINVPLPYTEAYASFGVRCLVGGDVPNNAGSLARVEVNAPAGSLLAAEPPRAVSARHAVGQMLPDLVFNALAQLLPGRIPAEGASCIWNPVFRGRDFVINPIFNGGTGARPRPADAGGGKDGLATTAFPSGVRTTSTEVNEATAPLLFLERQLALESGGNGALRGGDGQRIVVMHRRQEAFWVSRMFDRVHHPAAGRDGGAAGAAGIVLIEVDGEQRMLSPKGLDEVPAGARLVLQTPGGGGYQSPD